MKRTQVAPALSALLRVRRRLLGIAYRMVGSAAEAEDIVQDAWVRWQPADRSVVRDAAAFLVTTATRLAINIMQSAGPRRETYAGLWVPEPVDISADPRLEADDPERTLAELDRLATGHTTLRFENRLRAKDGSYHWISWKAAPDGERIYSMGRDITESRRAQDALNRAGELARVSRITAVSALTASIAHEINQPLSGIITNAATCLRMLDTTPPNIEGARETARRITRDGNLAADVIARLRALFTKREFALESLDLNEAAREVIALSSNDFQRNRIILQSELADDLPALIGDRIQLQQVILNLVRNACDAMADVHDRPRALSIKTEREEGDGVRLTIRDAGTGLSPQSLDSLFDAFYTTKSGGMGIGLFVSRSIIERHHGRLRAEPNTGGPGASFSFSLPATGAVGRTNT